VGDTGESSVYEAKLHCFEKFGLLAPVGGRTECGSSGFTDLLEDFVEQFFGQIGECGYCERCGG
jgi:hypothetical protein